MVNTPVTLQNVNPNIAQTDAPAIVEAFRWLAEATITDDKPLINVSQAAPVAAPHADLRRFMAETVMNDVTSHLYGPDLGLPALRAELAAQTGAHYGGQVSADQVAITAGCNQAYTAAIATLCAPGDEVILPTPWYFNHKMWLTMNAMVPVPLPTDDALLPDPDRAAALITDKTRAIVLVSPNNPGGVEYPADLILALYTLCKSRGIALILDETYRDFHSLSGAPHPLFTDPDWADTLIHLYSFSKAYRLTGHRVGAIITSAARLYEVEKYLDSTTICANQLGQRSALWGMQNLSQWLAGERDEILDRRAAITEAFASLDGWTLKGCGAYFAYVEHPYAMSSVDLARHLVNVEGVLMLPGTMFNPDPAGHRQMRIAFANVDRAGITQLFERLQNLTL